MYANGEGVPQDDVEAHMWFNLAASAITSEIRDNAVRARDQAAGLMNPTQIAEAERLAREWDAAHPR
jgi:TPR repeat protein